MRIYAPSRMQSVKDLPGQTTLKFRQPGQNTSEELLQGDLRSKLEEKERKHYLKTKSANFEEEREEDLRLLERAPDGGGGGGRTLVPKAADADDEDDADDSDSSSEDEVDPSFALKRRWDDDVVFRNQTRGEPKATKRFINDTIRNDFHRRFLDRYVR
ncbi:hypothetical protein CHLNCDRAFT_134109 [Chlorella variabilis]|uniref:Cwf15/Cwc15 cell cycle control protein n=1 Tax=Chlorella variabilis TaxID=554065 RepID=E1ZF09_CHLVA|nr:hypothetical protein CHLNCDRAFT_134109 [Chlorella variabilis]EFN55587.1 hypothetical protein CHLNCDRAFT_134109 [Chlorella variabilis]|eukprot:XP_005847689.1 hypothetical protein CHLNCDRAFT_134109 [Chlorella variabilis]